MTNDEIFDKANEFISGIRPANKDIVVVIYSSFEFDEGVYFVYQSERFTLYDDDRYQLIGNTRFIVDREDGKIFYDPAKYGLKDEYIKYFLEEKSKNSG